MMNAIFNRRTLRVLHVWIAGLGLSAALSYQLSAGSPRFRFVTAALITAALNVFLGRRLPAITAAIFVRRRLAALSALSFLLGDAVWHLAAAYERGALTPDAFLDPRWPMLPLVVIGAFAFRQGFGRAAGPRHVGLEWLSRRARVNWLLASVIVGFPNAPVLSAGYLVAAALGIGVHFAIRDAHYRRAEQRRAEGTSALAAKALEHEVANASAADSEGRAEAQIVSAGIKILSGAHCEATRLLAPLFSDQGLDPRLRAKALVLAAKAYGAMGDIAESTRSLDRAAYFDPDCPITIAQRLHLAPGLGSEPGVDGDPAQSPIGQALLAPRTAAGAADEVVRIVYVVNQTFFQVALGRFYSRRGYLGLAFESLDRAVERDPSSSVARLAMGYYWLLRRQRSQDDEFRKEAIATAHIHLHMCIMLEQNPKGAIASRAAEAIAESLRGSPRTPERAG